MSARSTHFYLSLGSNLGDRRENLKKGIGFLKTLGSVTAISRVYETEPVAMAPGGEKFYNLVLCLECPLSPSALLERIKKFEASMGRDIEHSHCRPRSIDIDILLADDRVACGPHLEIPHREMHKRAFVLVPLAEIAPRLVHPVLKKEISQLLRQQGEVTGVSLIEGNFKTI